ncbi:hypothetical protein BpHYR1_005712 [Brachionus plicatilis]|uniref:Uncharacterized protein n=1 Tax=Brachionus plicatilis TaxID=10195 RepID=A0A3M7PAX3_BRAPC|nr:hypothetical protein BpHYR1_005712 [Brachionus plicatilis]
MVIKFILLKDNFNNAKNIFNHNFVSQQLIIFSKEDKLTQAEHSSKPIIFIPGFMQFNSTHI